MNIFDKNISQEKRESLEFAEAARESEWKYPSFALKLFSGILDWNLIYPFPVQFRSNTPKGGYVLRLNHPIPLYKFSANPNRILLRKTAKRSLRRPDVS